MQPALHSVDAAFASSAFWGSLAGIGAAAHTRRSKMRTLKRVAIVGLAVMGVAFASAAHAQKNCVPKAAQGTNTTEEGAKFQAFEAILQATDWGVWAAWMANGSTPGYDIAKAKYRCTKGTGLGYTCIGQTTVCKKA